MAERIKVNLRASRDLYGSQEYTIILEVTNTGEKPLVSLEPHPQLVPGTILTEQEEQSTSELDALEDEKRRLFREMEDQVAFAYERQRWRKLSLLQQAIISYPRLPDILASRLSGEKARLFRLPHWAAEATRIENVSDIERLEQDFVGKEKEDSLLRTSFSADKAKVIRLLQEIDKRNADGKPEKEAPRLLPGDTVSFSYRCRAPHLYRQKALDCQFRVTYVESETKKSGSVTAGDSLSFYASAFAVPLGAILGACAGLIVKKAFVTQGQWFTGAFWIEVAGSVLLAIIVAFATSRAPDKKKVFTVEDFLGGFIIGAVSSLFSEQLITWMKSLVPKWSGPNCA